MSESTEWKRVKIAEACGFSDSHAAQYDMMHVDFGGLHGRLNGVWVAIPDYFNDLNACRIMEQYHPSRGEFRDRLVAIVARDIPAIKSFADADVYVISATAAQRAEAFGLTLGLWKPGQTEPLEVTL